MGTGWLLAQIEYRRMNELAELKRALIQYISMDERENADLLSVAAKELRQGLR